MQKNVEDFEPSYEWHKGEERDVIEFHVPGFKKEQLRVQITSYGAVKVSGDRIIDKEKRRSFRKELNLDTENYEWGNIRAKLLSECGRLQIMVPRKVPYSISSKEEGITAPAEKKMNGDEKFTGVEPASIKNGHQALGCGVKFGDSFWTGTLDKKKVTWLSATVAVTVAVAIGVYIVYRHWNVNDMDIYP